MFSETYYWPSTQKHLHSVKREIRACKCCIENITWRVSKPHFVPNCLEISRGRLQPPDLP